MSRERELLEQAVVSLEELTAELQVGIADAEVAKDLADRALALSAEISERLPRVIREIEDAAQGRTPGG